MHPVVHSSTGINLQSAHPIALIFLYLFRIAAIVMYILGGYFNNYVLSVRTKSQTHSQERSGCVVECNQSNINPSTLIDSNCGGAAVDGLLELQSKHPTGFISGNRANNR